MRSPQTMLILIPLAGFMAAPTPAKPDEPRGAEPFRSRIVPLLRDNCFQCHGVLKTSGLDLRSRETTLRGGKRGSAITPGNPEQSRLYRFAAGLDRIQMPPTRRLDPKQIVDISAWIHAGAPWPGGRIVDDRPWPYNKPVRPNPPKVKNRAWMRNPIDAFVLAKLEEKGLPPAPPADRRTLIRRAYLDLVGLLPTPDEVESFVTAPSTNAYPKLIDRLLASPRYGERWARHWLDLARYAESEGFKSDEPRPNAWRYRDYIIKSLNQDKPYDRFVREQIAGDELYPDDPDALIATGFCRHYPDESNARNLRLRRQEILNDITDVVGSTILGLTINCARCHDHKFDPIPQKDYYRLQAFFAAVRPRNDIPLIPTHERPEYERRMREWEEKTKETRAQIASIDEPIRRKIYHDHYSKFPPEIKEAIDTPPAKRTSLQWILFRKAEPQLEVATADIAGAMKGEQKTQWSDLNKRLDEFKPLHPGPMPTALGITDIGPEAPKTHTLKVGVYNAFKEEVQPGFPTICVNPSSIVHRPSSSSTGRRTTLANWLASPENPLTARVIANRLWHYHFGQGIVGTPSDFGNQGEKPANRELVDWLATELIRRGWSLKKMHRLIMTSSTYMQSSATSPGAARIDPENLILSRFRRQRLEGEAIRDMILQTSGELNLKMGGPSILPELPKGITTRGGWKETDDPRERSRRSIYVYVKRNLRYPLFEVFDMPDTHEPCARRQTTTTAPQALMLLNNDLILRSAQRFAGRVLKEGGMNPAARIQRAYRLAFGRSPSALEVQQGLAFLDRQAKLIRSETGDEDPLLLPIPAALGMDDFAGAALVDLCHALLNANEFVYIR